MGVTSLAARAWRHFFSVGVPNFGPAAAAPAGPAPTALFRVVELTQLLPKIVPVATERLIEHY